MREREVLRAFGKPVWTWPSVVAVDAGCYANSIEGKGEVAVYRGCAAEHGP